MPLNLIKLCVGADTPQDLLDWRAARKAAGHRLFVHTRQTPKRATEIIDGGSLYWVMKGVILVRQTVTDIVTVGEGVAKRCEIILDEPLIATLRQPRRAFQGWRYLETKDAPADMGAGADGADVPVELARKLREVGAW